jgi:hypothetical protein
MIGSVLHEYHNVFHDLTDNCIGCTSKIEHQIVTGEARPIKKPQYLLSPKQKEVVRDLVHEMLDKNIIRPSPDSSEKYRSCSFRSLNAVTHGDEYPIPITTEILDSLGNAITRLICT